MPEQTCIQHFSAYLIADTIICFMFQLLMQPSILLQMQKKKNPKETKGVTFQVLIKWSVLYSNTAEYIMSAGTVKLPWLTYIKENN